ncbi:SpoIIE family protein phosphatase [Clostridium aminobutyricum]|uniref:SpoIIE family protein phosphatase n=1 Tax=Clostridium aminobutyricum TaxID=33953 RepID=A0A939DB62_CLOAM|nr:SpoIIE family protein phosphatase [Clostridium aminobutyricum]MBN7774382.1 SpoIIE family protein phosphatase [Clostridium aminobutyricum]
MEAISQREKDSVSLAQIAGMVALSFLICRVVVLNTVFPCGVALITVLMYRSKLNIYLLLPMFLGLITYLNSNYLFYGDMAAFIITGIVFSMMNSKKTELSVRSCMALLIVNACNAIYYIAAKMFYRLDIVTMIIESLLILILIYIINNFLDFMKAASYGDYKRKIRSEMGAEKAIASISTIFVLMICGTGLWSVNTGAFSLPIIGGLLITLIFGYCLGISGGLIAGAATSMCVILCTSYPPAVTLVFLAGGFAAGIFTDDHRIVAAVCFSGSCLALGMITLYPELFVPPYEPLLASAVMVLIPKRFVLALRKVFSKVKRDHAYYEMETKAQVLNVLDEQLRTFERLSNLYGNARNNRNIIAYQFNGMAQVTEKLKQEIKEIKHPAVWAEAKPKFDVRVAHSAYGRSGGVSGDSFQYKEISESEYAILLSDGMGKGSAAAGESGLAVTTLMDLISAGFDVKLALKTVNNILLLQDESEIFSTVDLAMIDKIGGKLRLFKIGAAATFIKRGDKVAAVKMAALPLGIVDGLHIDFINVRLRPGDQIIMVSDGICDANREDLEMTWIQEAIRVIKSKDPQTISDLIVNKAVESYGIREKDDMTVITAVIQ